MPRYLLQSAIVLAALASLAAIAPAAERITLTSGFTVDCLRHEPAGTHTRLVLSADGTAGNPGYMEIATTSISSIEPLPNPLPDPHPNPYLAASTPPATAQPARSHGEILSSADLHPLLQHAAAAHRIDADLLASIVRAESGGDSHAVSRTGARGLMQLMPATASHLGVHDAFAPADNVDGGTAYLDQLLTRYHDNIALAVAAYNAGPGAVDRYRGVPPFRETRAYVARVIRDFNRRKIAATAADDRSSLAILRAGLR